MPSMCSLFRLLLLLRGVRLPEERIKSLQYRTIFLYDRDPDRK